MVILKINLYINVNMCFTAYLYFTVTFLAFNRDITIKITLPYFRNMIFYDSSCFVHLNKRIIIKTIYNNINHL